MVIQDSVFETEQDAQNVLERMHELSPGEPGHAELREEAIRAFTPLARRAALRFQRRGEELDDLIQVALVGLIKAVDRFDPDRGIQFVHYAVPTMTGELKRHFRDRAWSVRVNRRLQELHLRIAKAVPELSQQLQRMPGVEDLAEYLGESEDEIQKGLECAGAYATRSLSDTLPGSDGTQLADLMGDLDQQLELVPDRLALREVVSQLPEREQQILKLRFEDNLTQADIADLIGVSQMHISRLLTKAFSELKQMLVEDD